MGKGRRSSDLGVLELSSDLSGNIAIGLLIAAVTCRINIEKMLHMKEAVLVTVKQVMKNDPDEGQCQQTS